MINIQVQKNENYMSLKLTLLGEKYILQICLHISNYTRHGYPNYRSPYDFPYRTHFSDRNCLERYTRLLLAWEVPWMVGLSMLLCHSLSLMKNSFLNEKRKQLSRTYNGNYCFGRIITNTCFDILLSYTIMI